MRQRLSTSNRSGHSLSGNRIRGSRSRGSAAAVLERLEDRTLLSNSYSLTSGNLINNGVTVATNVIQYSVGRSGDAYYITPTTGSTTLSSLFINAGASSSDDFAVASVYKYGVINNSLNPFNGDAYYWNTVDGKLWLNTATSFIQISTDKIKDFGIRGNASETTTEDGYAYWWDSNNSLMMNTPTLSAPTTSLQLDADIQGFGLRNDGFAYYWAADSGSHSLFLNTPSMNYLLTSHALGFGMRSDGNGFYWDQNQSSDLFLNTPSMNINLSSAPVQSFAADGYCIDANAFNSSTNSGNYYVGGTGYFSTTGSTNLYKSSPSVGAGLVLSNLANSSLNLLWRVSSSDPGLGATVYVQTTTGNGSFVFEPLYGSPTVTTGSGPELTSSTVKEYVIYWGTQWPSPTGSPTQSAITSAIGTLFTTDYLKALSQYNASITGNATLAGTWNDTTDTLSSPFSDTQLQTVVSHAISTNGWPTTTVAAAANSAIYMVITPPGFSSSSSSDAGGYHKSFTSGSNEIVYGWSGNNGTLAGIMTTLSHETVEAITNPLVNVNNGITETAASAIDPLLGALGFTSHIGELADFEPNLLGYAFNFVNGVGATVYAAQAYWSNSLQAYILET